MVGSIFNPWLEAYSLRPIPVCNFTTSHFPVFASTLSYSTSPMCESPGSLHRSKKWGSPRMTRGNPKTLSAIVRMLRVQRYRSLYPSALSKCPKQDPNVPYSPFYRTSLTVCRCPSALRRLSSITQDPYQWNELLGQASVRTRNCSTIHLILK